MKKSFLVLVLIALVAAGAFAQVSLGGSATTNFTATTYPSFDFMYSLEKLDILGGANLSLDTATLKVGGYSQSESLNTFGLYGGVAPKVSIPGNWSLSFPVLANVVFGSKIDEVQGTELKGDIFGIGITGGGRATYSFSKNWSLYTGVLIEFFTWAKVSYPGSISVTETTFFYTALAQLGFFYTF